MKRFLALVSFFILDASVSAQDAYVKTVDAWHADRVARLTAEDGWLSLIGRDWLNPGENTLGSAPGSTVLLPEWAAPAKAGLFLLEGSTVRFRPFPGSGLLLNGKPATETLLMSDADGKPDILQAGRVRFYVIRRGNRFGIRIKDPEAPARKAFHGVPRFPVDPAWRVEAAFVPYATPQIRAIPTVLGTSEPMTAPGLLTFKVGGREITLEPMVEDPEHPELFLIFKDATSAHGTYAAGRFLYADMPRNGKVVLDFNRAINPPCAFTLFATCPLPPKQNQLDLKVLAGEQDPGLH
jgi:uncharacterized protein (DUF1684 family)